MSAGKHPDGVCTCKSHVKRPWNRPEHWTRAEVEYLEDHFGLTTDERLSTRLGRTVKGIRLKAKRMGLHKRTQGFTARSLGLVFGVDATTVADSWIGRGFLRSRRPFRQGIHLIHLVDPGDVERFIVEHPELVDADKMPESYYRDLAARDPWISLPEVRRRTGRHGHAVAGLIKAGVIRGRRRGTHWYVPASDVHLIRPLASLDAIEDSVFRRASNLQMRRNRRKGVVPRLGSGRTALPDVQRIPA